MSKTASVPGFLTKTFEIFNTPEYQDICSWGANGDTINIKKIEQFSKQILPKYFKHSNFQSFVRQLNMYDFHKTMQDPNHGEFQHQYFLKDRPDLLVFIKRKANNRTAETIKKLPKANHNSAVSAADSHDFIPVLEHGDDDSIDNILPHDLLVETDTVLSELEQQRLMHAEFERKMDDKMTKLELENELLKRLFVESNQKTVIMQERMEKVLKTLYTVFSGNPQLGKALLSRLPSLSIENGSFSSPKGLLTNGSAGDAGAFVAGIGDNGSSLRRMSSFDPYGALMPSSRYDHYEQPVPGAELNSANRGASFDFAAASVTAPQKYLSSLDRAIFGINPNVSNNSVGDELGVQSDRVTLLSDESPNKGQKRTFDSVHDSVDAEQPTQKVSRLDSLPIITSPSSQSPVVDSKHSGNDDNNLLGPNFPTDEMGRIEPQTRSFIDLLNRNQNTTLCRLDSLEQTLATLLDDMKEDDFLNDLSEEVVEDNVTGRAATDSAVPSSASS